MTTPTINGKTRPLAWAITLTIALTTCATWASLPTLAAAPHLRIALFATLGLTMLGLIFLFPQTTPTTARRLIITAAILLRLTLLPAPPSDDLHRYLWEGKLTLAGENPYTAPADHPRWEPYRDSNWHAINHRDRPTAYPPGIQWILAATAAIHPTLFSFKILALLGDLTALLLLLTLLRDTATPLRWAGFYAFNPATLIAFSAEGHFDSLMLAALLAAILAARKNKPSALLWLAIAIHIKLIAIILIPLFLLRKTHPNSPHPHTPTCPTLLVKILLLTTTLILPALPFLATLPHYLHALLTFATTTHFNAPLYTLLALIGLTPSLIKILCATTFTLTALTTYIARYRGNDLTSSTLILLSALLICSPTVHFWYLTWLLPLTALRPSLAWTTLTLTTSAYFLAWHTHTTHGWWGFTHTTAALIWLPFLLAATLQHRFLPSRFFRKKSPSPHPTHTHLSIIIPALHPTPTLTSLLHTLRHTLPPTTEILIISPTDTPLHLSEKTITAPRGRGTQIAAGIAATTGSHILILHADVTPPPTFPTDLHTAITTHPTTPLLIFGQRFDTQHPATLLIETLNELRATFTSIAFGDQTMLISRHSLTAAGGFPTQPLMEDVEVSLRLATQGPPTYLAAECTSHSGKWQKNPTPHLLLILRLLITYHLARLRSPHHAALLSHRLYRLYYPDNR